MTATATPAPGSPRDSRAPAVVTIAFMPRARAAALIWVLAIGVAILLAPFASGLLGATLLYIIGVRPFRRLAPHMREWLAALLVIVGVVLLIVGPLMWLVVQLGNQASGVISSVQRGGLNSLANQLQQTNVIGKDELVKAAETIVSWLSAQFYSWLSTAGSVILNFGIALFGLYYLLRAPEGSWAAVREYIPFSAKTADALRDRFVSVAEATLLGLGVVAFAQGTIIGLGFAIAGLPSPIFWGAVALLAAFVPMIGTTLVWLPATVVLMAQHRYGSAAVMAVMGGLLAGNIDQLLRPLVYRRVPHMHPIISLVGALAGVRVFGAMGLLLGPLLIYLTFELIRFFREEYATPALS